jgi:L-alanine-DL-glutamate epimerase-like enolase superfamily enzyme
VDVGVYEIPTDKPEADGTLTWNSTTLILVQLATASERGIGYTYGAPAAAHVIEDKLRGLVIGRDAAEHGAIWRSMVAAVRNMGLPGVAATAISAVDVALWDLRGKLLKQPVGALAGGFRDQVPVYGSGGFTSYTESELTEQLAGWVESGIPRVKMKIGKDWGASAAEDVARIQAARDAIGPDAELFVDANGAYSAQQAVHLCEAFQAADVSYFEEPVSSDHPRELALVRREGGIAIAAGEYGYRPSDFRDLLDAEAVDILQADATRCLGITGFLQAATQAYAHGVPFSAHCAPSIHAQAACGLPQISHIEYFHDHARIEHMLFEGALTPDNHGCLRPDPTRPGLGLEFRVKEAERWRK